MTDFVRHPNGWVDLTRLTDGRVMCCVCFAYTPQDELWVDPEGQRWDMCKPCGEKEGAP